MIDGCILRRVIVLGALLLRRSAFASIHFHGRSASRCPMLWPLFGPFGDLFSEHPGVLRAGGRLMIFHLAKAFPNSRACVWSSMAKKIADLHFPKNVSSLFVEVFVVGEGSAHGPLIWPAPQFQPRAFSNRSIGARAGNSSRHIRQRMIVGWQPCVVCISEITVADHDRLPTSVNGHISTGRQRKCSVLFWLFFRVCGFKLFASFCSPISVFRICDRRLQSVFSALI